MKRKISIPNCITLLRMMGTVVLAFLKPFTRPFFIVYTLAGLTDILDGWIARKTNAVTAFGAKLDSVADLTFYAVMLIKIFPVLWVRLPVALWNAIAVALVIRLAAYITAAVKFRRFAALHTGLNKLTGAGMFLLPYFLLLPWTIPLCWCVCASAMLGALEELLLYLLRKEYDPNVRSLFSKT